MERLNDRKLIINIIQELLEKRNTIFKQIVKYAIASEFKELGNTFEIKEDQEFTLAHFADSENQNIVLLVEMCHKIDTTIYEIINKNSITENELY